MNWNNKNKTFAFMVAGLFVLTGTYNAVVINSESHLSGNDIKFVKRLDEMYGVTIKGREVAAVSKWQKLAPSPITFKKLAPIVEKITQAEPAAAVVSADIIPQAAVQEELTLSLVEVINPKKWQQGLTNTQFSGSLSTNNGVIEDLSVALPNGEGVAVSFSEMTGNVFEYDLNGEYYSGMMYQVDKNSYMVTLTNGPLEGTRLRFSGVDPQNEQQETQQLLAENNNVSVGNFGNESYDHNDVSPEKMLENDQQMQQEAIQAQSFNFNQPESL
ncbi:MAG: hypothetical protein NDI69_05940 [Bacteriovoracaceae bacterium]|nr:hypothetical protein [Bacteriovoracaceae bacterium]